MAGVRVRPSEHRREQLFSSWNARHQTSSTKPSQSNGIPGGARQEVTQRPSETRVPPLSPFLPFSNQYSSECSQRAHQFLSS